MYKKIQHSDETITVTQLEVLDDVSRPVVDMFSCSFSLPLHAFVLVMGVVRFSNSMPHGRMDASHGTRLLDEHMREQGDHPILESPRWPDRI